VVRLQSEIQVTVRKTVIGGPDPLICLPLVAAEKHGLLDQAAALKQLKPDMAEWRIDGYQGVEDTADCLAALNALRLTIGDIPLIFTCRIEAEGGMQPISQKARRILIDAAIRSGAVDIVDIELINDVRFIEDIRQIAGRHGVKLILSYHDFEKTPDEGFICGKLKMAQTLGADIAKVALMPKDYQDVLTLLNATLKARTQVLKIPLVTMSMAQEGVITRMAGGLFGSDISFATGRVSSAPGQIPIGELRRAMALLYA
jgi:3-dehydroquinate dehydratase I